MSGAQKETYIDLKHKKDHSTKKLSVQLPKMDALEG